MSLSKENNLVPVILAGGSGTRLWPLSRSMYPKQFLPLLAADESMLQLTIKRLNGLANLAEPILLCNDEHRFLAEEQLRQIACESNGLILEPVGRNTAPAIAAAAFHAMKSSEDALLLVLAADHDIKNIGAFHEAIARAVDLAQQGKLVTFGIVADEPETGYGYIQRGEALGDASYEINKFKEKPNLETAKKYLASGDYLWNSGMFVFKASVYLQELEKLRPELYEASRLAYEASEQDLNFIRLNEKLFSECPSESIDYAVMENTKNAAVVSLDAGWNDLGSWESVYKDANSDENGNAITPQTDAVCVDTKNSYINGGSRLITTLGVENLIIIDTPSALLIADRSKIDSIKLLLTELKGREELDLHSTVHRPWGSYTTVDEGERFKVKRITVKQGAKLSTQLHHHRAEHWVVVSGTAKVLIGEEEKFLHENESVYIPKGTVHYLENPGKIQLDIIEIQSGEYLGEDDIIRLNDKYGRSDK
ncbi:mannose-1-phosphate guanylyltransferase/mannose-6-phosphate isomerase [Lentisphaera profundi]|uniref:mannose-1-phosphate guanylyltransferase n=1 Tax=Lentisphaera profundi TaxID=1658616 RepID=A0ABY7VPB3_9BACT|nr:mannose-1-phosphate guanylyltransferase/mannose-6-phosphate isomerase [Lentisphaera profundi]WDE95985.1 mannose-1-phosphate guanylyltransferase/mannose-6-phosphate isomerase [Lentisphaera profundi]